MPSEHVLQLRITEAAKDAARAVQNRDQYAYERAMTRYHKFDNQLRVLEAERNERAVTELEAKANAQGNISMRDAVRSGIPLRVMQDRGWMAGGTGTYLARAPKQPTPVSPPAEPQGTEP